jgi:hypothetical protein
VLVKTVQTAWEDTKKTDALTALGFEAITKDIATKTRRHEEEQQQHRSRSLHLTALRHNASHADTKTSTKKNNTDMVTLTAV